MKEGVAELWFLVWDMGIRIGRDIKKPPQTGALR